MNMNSQLEGSNPNPSRPFLKTFVKQSFRKETGDGAIIFAKSGSIYRLESILGVGGLSVIYKAKRFSDGVSIALKLANCQKESKAVAFIEHEGKVLSTLNHPSIVTLLEFGETVNNEPFLALELLKGQTLDQLLLSAKVLPFSRAINICQSVAQALDYAHNLGILHRDIKPGNIMIETAFGKENIKVFDFGISATNASIHSISIDTSSGSLLYATPEQLESGQCTKQSDVYQLALVLFEALTGRLPFEISVQGAVSYRKSGPVLLDDSELKDSPLEQNIRSLLELALSRDPNQRPCSMNLFAHELSKIMLKLRVKELKTTSYKEAITA